MARNGRRHAGQVNGVVEEAITAYRRGLRERRLPPSCLIHLVLDPGAAEGDSGPAVSASESTARPRPENGFRNGSQFLDLAAAARIDLAGAGVRAEHVFDLEECTACHPARYFSHRRDRGVTGRLWAVAALAARAS